MSVHPRDIPWFVAVSLGADKPGSFFDREQRSVPLWRYVGERTGVRDGYEFRDESDVVDAIERAAADLIDHAADFLTGDLASYDRLRRRVLPLPRTVMTLSLVGQLLLMPWRYVWWVARGGRLRVRKVAAATRAEVDQEDFD